MSLQSYLSSVLGDVELVHDHSWPHRGSVVRELRDRSGRCLFVKQHSQAERYQAERDAYLTWVPALGDAAPTVLHHCDELRVLVLTALPGAPAASLEPAVHHRAGAVLRRLHEARPADIWDGFARDRLAQLEQWVPQAAPLLDRALLDFAADQVVALAQLPAPLRVPCHLDYSPRNWLVDGIRVRVLDFEWCRLDVWVNDLTRLSFGVWQQRPDLERAFLSGYGAAVSGADRAILTACGAARAVELVVRARRIGERALEESSRQALHRLAAAASAPRPWPGR